METLLNPPTITNLARVSWDLNTNSHSKFEAYWQQKDIELIPREHFTREKVWMEIGAGTGWFFSEMAKRNPDTFLIAIERCRERARRLVRKAEKSALPNFAAFRGNAIPVLLCSAPSESIDRIYILYPCPWPKNSQRKNRWYLHPMMAHLHRVLKKGGEIVWASDQQFFIEEAHYVCENKFAFQTLASGPLSTNPYNSLEQFPGGRSKFERTFLAEGLTCYEYIARKT